MNKILYICDTHHSKYDINELNKLNYTIDVIIYRDDIIDKCLQNKYNYIIIDLEFGKKIGDRICKMIRETINYKVPIIGIYSYHKKSPLKYKYHLLFFNYIETRPILSWSNLLLLASNSHLLDFDNTSIFKNYIRKEVEINDYLCKKYIGYKPKRKKIIYKIF